MRKRIAGMFVLVVFLLLAGALPCMAGESAPALTITPEEGREKTPIPYENMYILAYELIPEGNNRSPQEAELRLPVIKGMEDKERQKELNAVLRDIVRAIKGKDGRTFAQVEEYWQKQHNKWDKSMFNMSVSYAWRSGDMLRIVLSFDIYSDWAREISFYGDYDDIYFDMRTAKRVSGENWTEKGAEFLRVSRPRNQYGAKENNADEQALRAKIEQRMGCTLEQYLHLWEMGEGEGKGDIALDYDRYAENYIEVLRRYWASGPRPIAQLYGLYENRDAALDRPGKERTETIYAADRAQVDRLFSDYFGVDFALLGENDAPDGRVYVNYPERTDQYMGMRHFVYNAQSDESGFIYLYGYVANIVGADGYHSLEHGFRAVLRPSEDSLFGYQLVEYRRLRIGASPRFAHGEASSVRKPSSGKTYGPLKAADGDLTTTWCESAKGDGVGEWIRLEFAEETAISALQIQASHWGSDDLAMNNNDVRALRLEFSDGTVLSPVRVFAPWDSMHSSLGNFVFLPYTLQTRYVKITVLESHPGAKYNDSVISEITAYP